MTEPSLQALREARDALDAVIEEIQAVPGFKTFLAPPDFDDIAAAAEDPVVYLAAADPGGLALIVRGDVVVDIDLPGLTRAALAERVQAYRVAYDAYRADPQAGRADWERALSEVTDWLWQEAMGRVVDELLGARAAVLADPPRVFLVPGGLLGLLPLHAAWRPDASRPTGREHVLDLLQIAYIPNAQALSAAREKAKAVTGRRVFAVAAPSRAAGLPMTGVEARAARLAFPDGHIGRRRTSEEFLLQIRAADVVHVACHGLADLDEPLNSRLELAPGEDVTLGTLMAQELTVRLAVLSACETLLPGTDLPDEVVALPTGLIQAGAAGVLASMWAVPDLASAMLMIEFYGFWRERPDDPGSALRLAQIWLRDTPERERVRRYQAATRGQGWPPPRIADEVLTALAATSGADPADHPLDGLSGWAAFAHVGV
ncbi:MAG TPA: CHAT domain-containing protein [Nakamurella sp.]